jgi:hypothetical protein
MPPHLVDPVRKLLQLAGELEGGEAHEAELLPLKVGPGRGLQSVAGPAGKGQGTGAAIARARACCCTPGSAAQRPRPCPRPTSHPTVQHPAGRCPPLQPGQEVELSNGSIVRPFATVHPIPSQVRGGCGQGGCQLRPCH